MQKSYRLGILKLPVSLRVADLDDLWELTKLVLSYHAFEGITCPGVDIKAAISPLLGTNDLGRVWLVEANERIAGYVAICFGYSIEFGGRDAFVDEMYQLEPYRGQGIGSAALCQLKSSALDFGVRALHLEVARTNARAQRLYEKAGFAGREQFFLMTTRLG